MALFLRFDSLAACQAVVRDRAVRPCTFLSAADGSAVAYAVEVGGVRVDGVQHSVNGREAAVLFETDAPCVRFPEESVFTLSGDSLVVTDAVVVEVSDAVACLTGTAPVDFE